MFGLFRKVKKMKTPPEEPGIIAQGAKHLIGSQLFLTNKCETDLLSSKLTLGYLTGVCDAIAQRRGVPEDEHELVGMAIFGILFPASPQIYATVLELGHDQEFEAGQIAGGQETMNLLTKKIEIATGLIDYWKK